MYIKNTVKLVQKSVQKDLIIYEALLSINNSLKFKYQMIDLSVTKGPTLIYRCADDLLLMTLCPISDTERGRT